MKGIIFEAVVQAKWEISSEFDKSLKMYQTGELTECST